ncbi:MAG: hypothetical protein ACRD3K_09575, partial [Edaphobacter sp.]
NRDEAKLQSVAQDTYLFNKFLAPRCKNEVPLESGQAENRLCNLAESRQPQSLRFATTDENNCLGVPNLG